jgi:thymidine kinase
LLKVSGHIILSQALFGGRKMKRVKPGPGLHVIIGCVRAGKTEAIISLVRLYEIAGLDILKVKPVQDTRSGAEFWSRNGTAVEAVIVTSPDEIFKLVKKRHKIIAIDEVQFFDECLLSVVEKLILAGKYVIVAGLNLDWRGRPFSTSAGLMAMATEEIDFRQAVCMTCGSLHANRSRRTTLNKETVEVGFNYEPQCIRCFVPPLDET